MTTHERASVVDTLLADIWARQQEAQARADQDLRSLHRALRHQQDRRGHWYARGERGSFGPEVTDEQTEAEARALIADPNAPWPIRASEGSLAHAGLNIERALAELDAQRAALAALEEEASPLEAEYAAERWSRFFLVTNANGHIHSSMRCSTCRWDTRFAWLPTLSGLTEADAVAQEGPKLCSVCFPSAPVEWTVGVPTVDPNRCPGSGQAPVVRSVEIRREQLVGEWPNSRWERVGTGRFVQRAFCPVCDREANTTNTGAVRAHKIPKGAA